MTETKKFCLGALGLVALQGFALYLLGQPPIAASGEVHLWWGTVLSSGNSQHISDWYTFSHIVHGFLFYAALWVLFPRMPIGMRFLLALGIEVAWEVIENTPMVINHYREQALAQGYIGDSILNSISDSFAMVIGFLAARRLPTLVVVAIALGLELFTLYMIRDNLALNIINLIHTFPALSAWQASGPH